MIDNIIAIVYQRRFNNFFNNTKLCSSTSLPAFADTVKVNKIFCCPTENSDGKHSSCLPSVALSLPGIMA